MLDSPSPVNYGLNIRQEGALDFLALGALVHRLDPGIVPFRKATHCDLHVSGGEFNVAADLSDCFRLKTGIVTAMVDYPIGDLIAGRVRAMGVTPFYTHFEHDGVCGPNMAAVYSDRGQGIRPPVVFYNRSNEAAAQLKPGDIDWKSIFSRGVRWFHSGGIFAALSPKPPPRLIIEAMHAAKAAGAVTSFDLNYRAKLWNIVGGHDRAVAVLDRIVKHVDVLVGNEEDLQLGPGHPRTRGRGRLETGSGRIPGHDGTRAPEYPQVKIVATTLREVHSTNRHSWGAMAWIDGNVCVSPTCELEVLDRVGGGDGYAAGFFFGLLSGVPGQEAVNLGWAHGALLTTFPGDTTMATVDEVRTLAGGGSARIQG